MKNLAKVIGLSVAVFLVSAAPAAAQDRQSAVSFSGAIGAGLVTMGAAYGIGKLAAASVESMSRQPEVAPRIFTSLLLAAALIEGFTFFALYICMTQNPWATS